MIEAVTPNGKKIQVILDKRYATYRFQFVPGGELPEELTGQFVDERNAKIALARYLEKIKSKKNAQS